MVSRLPELISAEKPDAIIFTGDSINSRKAVPLFRHVFAALASTASTFAVLGNHDTRCWGDLELFRDTNVVPLNGASCKLRIDGQDIYFA